MPELIQDIDWYLERLEGVEGGNGQYSAWCPCHEDYGTSVKGLSLTQQGKRLLAKCHSPHCGATLTQVYQALSEHDAEEIVLHVTHARNGKNGPVEIPELGSGMTWWVSKTGVPAEIWHDLGCVDYSGGVAFEFGDDYPFKYRKPPKAIGWEPAGSNIPPIWPIPPDECPEHITLVEGESDCGTAHAARMPYAFSITAGAKAHLPPQWATAFAARGVQRITICGDLDESGLQFSARAAREATGAGLTVEVIRLETVIDPFSGLNDLNDVWQACETEEEFLSIIARATQQIAERIPFLSVEEMEEEAGKEVDWLIPELIAPGDKIMLAAPQKSLKSWIALELTRALVTKTAFLKRAEWVPTRTSRVGFVQEEGSKRLWARRVEMLQISGNTDAVFAHKTGFRFTDPSYIDELISSTRDQGLDILLLDPLQRMMPGLDSNSDTDTGLIWDEVFRIQQALPHLVIMLVHHANKHDRLSWDSIRGSSRHAGEVDVGIFLERHPFEDATLRMWLDGRDIPQYLGTGEVFDVKYQLDRDARIADFDGTEMSIAIQATQIVGKDNKRRVLEAVSQGHDTVKKVMEETSLGEITTRQHLRTLVEDNEIRETEGAKRQRIYTLA